MNPLNEVNREFASEMFSRFTSIFPLPTAGFLHKAKDIYCLAYYLENELVLAIVVSYYGKSGFTIIANHSINVRSKKLMDERMNFKVAFEALMSIVVLDGVRQNIVTSVANSLTNTKIEEFKEKGIVC